MARYNLFPKRTEARVTDPDALNRELGIPKVASFDNGEGGLTRLTIKSAPADAEIYLHGAHVTRFDPKDQAPVLFLSKMSQFKEGKPIRGGVPICFPWFGPKAGDAKAPAHGFARLMEWKVESITPLKTGVSVVLSLASTEETKTMWPVDFSANYMVTVGEELHLSLTVTNTGTSPFKFEEALHNYFTIGDIEAVSIEGLSGTTYLDKMNAATPTPQGDEPIQFTGETDRVYLATQSTCVIHDPSLGREIRVAKSGSDATVVWNPWINKAKAMPDFGDDEWPGMVCVETCNVADEAVKLAPGASHTMTAMISTPQ
jgi:D-hexose-6-phosphate mutarotase